MVDILGVLGKRLMVWYFHREKTMVDELREYIAIVLAFTVLMTFQSLNVMYSRLYQLTEYAWAMELVANCELWDVFPTSQPSKTMASAIPRVDAIRLWPLPLEQPWDEDD